MRGSNVSMCNYLLLADKSYKPLWKLLGSYFFSCTCNAFEISRPSEYKQIHDSVTPTSLF